MKILLELLGSLVRKDTAFAAALKRRKVSPGVAGLLRLRRVVLSDEVLIGLMVYLASQFKDMPAQLAEVDQRLARVETRLGIVASDAPGSAPVVTVTNFAALKLEH